MKKIKFFMTFNRSIEIVFQKIQTFAESSLSKNYPPFWRVKTPIFSCEVLRKIWSGKIQARSKPKLLHFCHMLQMFLSLLRKELYFRYGKIIHNKKDHIFDQNISFSGVFILYKSGPFKVDQKVNIVITHNKVYSE